MRKLALVTGATSGIGRAFADRLGSDGYDLIAVGRDDARLGEVATAHPAVTARPVASDLSTAYGVDSVIASIGDAPVDLLVNNAGLAHYGPLADLLPRQVSEVLGVKAVAPVMLTRAVVGGMIERGRGSIINVGGMIAFSGPAPASVRPNRAVYGGTLAHILAFSQLMSAELQGTGVHVQALLPGVVATEFHTRQGMDLSGIPRMSAADVVTASLRGLELGETVTAPGVEDASRLDAVFRADLDAFASQSVELASRYRS
jgi:uncharacterized protein